MVTDSVQQQSDELRATLRAADRAYYVLAAPVMSDKQYDATMRKLQQLEKANPELVDPTSPTQRVGGEIVDALTAVQHPTAMLSLENAFSEDDLTKWLTNWADTMQIPMSELLPQLMIEPKIDGVAVNLVYEEGQLKQAISRGNGITGDDVIHNVRTMATIPQVLIDAPESLRSHVEVRGEIYIDRLSFVRIQNEQHRRNERLSANPRNLAAGSLRLLDSSLCKLRSLRFLAHGVASPEFSDHRQAVDTLKAAGIPYVAQYTTDASTLDEFFDHLTNLRLVVAPSLPMEVDGWVLKLPDSAIRKQLGHTSKCPRWAVAFKLETYEAETTLRAIEWTVGRTGAVTPVAALEPVSLAGTMNSSASVHNAGQLTRLNVRIGDRVVVQKAGKIIPQIVKLAKRMPGARSIDIPTACPRCKAKLQHDTNADGSLSEALYCPDVTCPARWVAGLIYFASRDVMDIRGLGDVRIQELVEAKLLTRLTDIYYLHKRRDSIIANSGLAEKGTDALLAAIEESKEQPYWRVLRGLGIRHVGKTVSQRLMSVYASPVDVMYASELDLCKVIGSAAAKALVHYADIAENRQLVAELVEHFKVGRPEVKAEPTSSLLATEVVCVTGKLQTGTRDEIHEMINSNGGTVVTSVSKNTTLLVVGEDAGSKLAKAQKLGIRVQTEAEFLALLQGA